MQFLSKGQWCGFLLAGFLSLIFSVGKLQAAGTIGVELVASGFHRPVFVTAPANDHDRLFIVEQYVSGTAESGKILIFDRNTGSTKDFLVIDGITRGSEQGLLGLAFHPQFAENGYFYVNYTMPGGGGGGHTEVARFQVEGDPMTATTANASSKKLILSYPQPYANHNGGWLEFGLDGYLYISSGDGGSGNDPQGNAQNRSSLLGKILRIDIDSDAAYTIPDGNPFKDHATYKKEIWAFGLRNPWRCSIDRETGDLWIGDVGQGAREEIDFNPAGEGGLNFGWRAREGDIQNPGRPGEQPVTAAVEPIFSYPRSSGYSVTGGYVYRGNKIPELEGKYIFADYGSGRFWVTTRNGGEFTTVERTAELNPATNKQIGGPSSFGEDAAGELYVCDLSDGQIFRIVSLVPPAPNLSGAAINGENEFVFSFHGLAGESYIIESKLPVSASTWDTVRTIPALAGDQDLSVTNEVIGGERYFRVRVQ